MEVVAVRISSAAIVAFYLLLNILAVTNVAVFFLGKILQLTAKSTGKNMKSIRKWKKALKMLRNSSGTGWYELFNQNNTKSKKRKIREGGNMSRDTTKMNERPGKSESSQNQTKRLQKQTEGVLCYDQISHFSICKQNRVRIKLFKWPGLCKHYHARSFSASHMNVLSLSHNIAAKEP